MGARSIGVIRKRAMIALALWISSSARAQDAPPIEVTVREQATEVQRMQRSAEAVTVVDTKQAKKRSADLGEVLARVQGVSLRRTGGLGTDARFGLNGLYDDQVRFFVDGIPLDFMGYPFGLANVPVNLLDAVEIYRGVVPIRFGADALGGAVNLVTHRPVGTSAAVSYQVGSFGQHRLTLDARYHHEASGFVASATGFFDRAKNDYRVRADVYDDLGHTGRATVKRFNDAYQAGGGAIELGFLDRPWARKLLVRGFVAGYGKQLQSNLVMTDPPYGDVHYGERQEGATLTYEQPLHRDVELTLLANYSHREIDFVDIGHSVYDWRGDIRNTRPPRAGEVGRATDQTLYQDSGFGRALVAWKISQSHALRASVTPTYVARTGRQHLDTMRTNLDPVTAQQALLTLVSGLEYELNAIAKRPKPEGADDYSLQNIAFVKSYVYRASGQELEVGNRFHTVERNLNSFGGGDSFRVELAPGVYLKASYEFATRLPRADEVFGNGVLVDPNLELKPELSHNGNVGPHLEYKHPRLGELTLDVNAFLRRMRRQIAFIGGTARGTYENIYEAHSYGLEAGLLWSSVKRYLTVHANPTWLENRNDSTEGRFANTKGDRIPNRPYLFASWGGTLRFARLLMASDALEPFYEGRWVHEFYRSWESLGNPQYKKTVPKQIAHGIGITYSARTRFMRWAGTVEVQNITDGRLYDLFGAQRPGRAYYFKLSGELE